MKNRNTGFAVQISSSSIAIRNYAFDKLATDSFLITTLDA